MRQILFFGLIFVAWTNAQCLLNGFTAPLENDDHSFDMAFNDGTGYWLHVWIAPGLGDGEREIHGRLARYDGIPIDDVFIISQTANDKKGVKVEYSRSEGIYFVVWQEPVDISGVSYSHLFTASITASGTVVYSADWWPGIPFNLTSPAVSYGSAGLYFGMMFQWTGEMSGTNSSGVGIAVIDQFGTPFYAAPQFYRGIDENNLTTALFDPKLEYSSNSNSFLAVIEFQLSASSQTYILMGLQFYYYGYLGYYRRIGNLTVDPSEWAHEVEPSIVYNPDSGQFVVTVIDLDENSNQTYVSAIRVTNTAQAVGNWIHLTGVQEKHLAYPRINWDSQRHKYLVAWESTDWASGETSIILTDVDTNLVVNVSIPINVNSSSTIPVTYPSPSGIMMMFADGSSNTKKRSVDPISETSKNHKKLNPANFEPRLEKMEIGAEHGLPAQNILKAKQEMKERNLKNVKRQSLTTQLRTGLYCYGCCPVGSNTTIPPPTQTLRPTPQPTPEVVSIPITDSPATNSGSLEVSSSNSRGGRIAGIVIGVILIIVFLVVLGLAFGYFLHKRKKRQEAEAAKPRQKKGHFELQEDM